MVIAMQGRARQSAAGGDETDSRIRPYDTPAFSPVPRGRSRNRCQWLGAMAVGVGLSVLAPIPALAHVGRAPTPDDLWSTWAIPPLPAIVLLITGWLYARGVATIWNHSAPGRGIRRWQVASFAAGLLALALALLSPLDSLSNALLSAHMTQHLLLIVIAPPLLVAGAPLPPILLGLPRAWRISVVGRWHRTGIVRRAWRFFEQPLVAWLIAAIVLWGWHVPVLYEAALRHSLLHELEHVMFLGSSLLLWWALIAPLGRGDTRAYGIAMIAVFTTALQGAAFGVLMTFAKAPWYPVYGDGAVAWHMTALEDQQFAGTIMWVPAGFAYLAAILCLMLAWLREAERTAQRDEGMVQVLEENGQTPARVSPPSAVSAGGHQEGVGQWA